MRNCCAGGKERGKSVGEKVREVEAKADGGGGDGFEGRERKGFLGRNNLFKGCMRRGSSVEAEETFTSGTKEAEGNSIEEGDERRQGRRPANRIQKNLAELEQAVMSLLPRLRRRQRTSNKKSSSRPNPYASRGLDQFASLYAELAAKRELLAAQTGAPVSLVRFTSGSHRTWVPIIVSQQRKTVVADPEPPLAAGSSKDEAIAIADAAAVPQGAVEAVTAALVESAGLKSANTDTEREKEEAMVVHEILDKWWSLAKDQAWQKISATATLGAFYVGRVAAVGVTMAVAIAYSVLLRRIHSQNLSGYGLFQALEKRRDAEADSQKLLIDQAPKPLPRIITAAPITEEEPALASTPDNRSPSLVKEIAPAPVPIGSPSREHKQRSRFKSKFLTKHSCKKEPLTAPSSPNASNEATFFSSIPNTPAMRDVADSSLSPPAVSNGDEVHLRIGRGEGRILQERRLSRLGRPKPTIRETSSLKNEQKVQQSGQLAAVFKSSGLLVVLCGLLVGRMVAIFLLLCWWYTVPKLRQLAGDIPVVKGHSEIGKRNHQRGSRRSKMAGGSNNKQFDLHSHEYRKKVIMEGLLERGRKSTG